MTPSAKEIEAYELAKKVDAAVGLIFPGNMYTQPEDFKAFCDEQLAKYRALPRNE